MDPSIPTLPISKAETAPGAGPVIFHSPFDAATEYASTGLVSQLPVRPLLWDVAVRRFSSPSFNANRQRLTAHIDSARTAYAKAFVSIQRSIKDVDAAAILSHSSETDVAQTALDLFSSSSNENNGRVSRFIDVLHHYQGVFDVLSQAGDFAYLAVVWGGMKMLLMMAKNKKDLLAKVTDMLVEIGLTLSRIEVYAKLYPTARMVELISMIYAAVAEFLEEVILHFHTKSPVRKFLSGSIRPFDDKFGRAMERIHRLESCIEKDASLLHAMQTATIAQHQLDAFLHRTHLQTTLTTTTPPQPNPLQPSLTKEQVPAIFLAIKQALFRGFPDQATYHESLAATYSVTARAWEEWFAVEQQHLPSTASRARGGGGTRLSQGLCDAPDHQHALQWVAQQRRLSPEVPSVYLIWAQGMTVHTAVASLVFQVLQQRPEAVVELNLDMDMFGRATTSVKALWDVFVYLMRALGGCLVYISIGSAGEDEFAIVDKFVRTVRSWDGPPIWVTMIHPYNEGFEGIATATDLDGLYDVHPSLTTTDALHHVLMLELDIHQVSNTIQTVLWEAVWRETRYASVGISFTGVVDMIQGVAEELSREEVEGVPLLEGDARKLWIGGVRKWINHPVASNTMREMVQRHLDIVALALPEDIRAAISRHLKCLVLKIDGSKAGSFASRSMTETQRHRVWDKMKAVIIPASEAMFCTTIRELLSDALESFCEVPCQSQRQAGLVVGKLLNYRFGLDGEWKSSMSWDAQLMARGIQNAIMSGFADTIDALSEPEEGTE
ncbi:hypothetical protein C8A00DRAFT_42577 [Chaetomidium leptoderma]|uniref:DUF7708 domain-containing protein n=1 Tax=Chaetomidium leptoderma TaxID=669021 RepID=A0AAN6ZZJ2_9PEZI|nr:hypothetical protein C8A00DRAFT_42577 [Chaetomidium leptoderma]